MTDTEVWLPISRQHPAFPQTLYLSGIDVKVEFWADGSWHTNNSMDEIRKAVRELKGGGQHNGLLWLILREMERDVAAKEPRW